MWAWASGCRRLACLTRAELTGPGLGGVRCPLALCVPATRRQGKLHFAQWTARIPSRQVVAVYDNRGKLLAGEPQLQPHNHTTAGGAGCNDDAAARGGCGGASNIIRT